ncbi:hypothetical protein RND81_06G246200 [Saponaria officinalis]|uniref:HMA domain-containing protein n=1 Tax=Saponaria officinalis TaxID=3572 RepID=A0AAW1KF94_SAPOF
MEIKKVVVKLNIQDNKDKQSALKAVSCLPGINSLEANIKENKMIIIGEVDPVAIICKLRKQWNAQILTVGPPEKKDDKKDGNKKDGEKKDGDKKDGDKKDGDKKAGDKKDGKDQTPACKPCPCPNPYPYPYSYPQRPPMYYYAQSMEENPNSCVIC